MLEREDPIEAETALIPYNIKRQRAYFALPEEKPIALSNTPTMIPYQKGTTPPQMSFEWADMVLQAKEAQKTALADSAQPSAGLIQPIKIAPLWTIENQPQAPKLEVPKKQPQVVLRPQGLLPHTHQLSAPPVTPLELKITAEKPEPVFIPRPLDMVFVMDTSLSMRKHLQNFKTRFADYLSYFDSLDWQLMITNADHGAFFSNAQALKGEAMQLERDGQILEELYLDPSFPHYNSIFLSSVSIHKIGEYKKFGENIGLCNLPPGCQSYKEQPLKSLKSALVKNPHFFRKEADLVAILISNSQVKTKGKEAVTPEAVIEQFEWTQGAHKRFEVYGLIIREGDQKCLKRSIAGQSLLPEAGVARKIQALSDMTGGEVFSLCSSDYQDLALSIAQSFENPPPTR